MKNWEKILVNKEDTIISILEVLNNSGTQFVAVVDADKKLLGALTDGDIRRGLVRGIQLQDKVEKVMNVAPKTLPSNTPKEKILKIMKEKDIHHLPLVNEKNIIVNIVSVEELVQVERKENHVILMAGGLGARLADLTTNCPKPMLKVGGKPILETIIEIFKEHGFYKFIIAVNYKSEMIEEYFKDGSHLNVEITYLKEKSKLGTAGALSLYQKNNNLPFIVMNGDLLTKINFSDLINFHVTHGNAATMCLRQYEHQIPFGVVVTEEDRILKIEEKPVRRYFINGGIYVLSPEVLKKIPHETNYDMPTFFENLIEENHKVGAYPFYEYWIDIGRLDDYERAHTEFLEIFK
jgi:dTDP-glucose pyrophosphorylase/predicted transcriptional regulator